MSDEGIGQVTNAGRYAVLHTAADTLLADLETRYWTVRTEGLAVDPDLIGRGTLRVVRLAPVNPDGAPVTVDYTDFPGLGLRFGRWYITSLPICGCDYCDDDPDDLIDDLRFMVSAAVAGGFQEYCDGQVSGTFKSDQRLSSNGGWGNATRAAQDIAQPADNRWRAWILRSEGRPTPQSA